jgi:hypothetical protein
MRMIAFFCLWMPLAAFVGTVPASFSWEPFRFVYATARGGGKEPFRLVLVLGKIPWARIAIRAYALHP